MLPRQGSPKTRNNDGCTFLQHLFAYTQDWQGVGDQDKLHPAQHSTAQHHHCC